MAQVINTIRITGPLPAVFDLLTTTRLWTQWHPATTGVGGVTQRPFQLGDQVRERACVGAHTYEGVWTVVEHERPNQARLRGSNGRIEIAYRLQQMGDQVEITRILDFYSADFLASLSGSVPDVSKIEPLMHAQSEQALRKLQALVEGILQAEANGQIQEE
jgi:hypothetical protein